MNHSSIKGLITKLNNRLAALEPGERLVKYNLHNDVYHGAHGVSTSKIKLFIKCPEKYRARYVDRELLDESKSAFDFGSAAHSFCLEPHNFERDNVIQPADIKVRRGKLWDAFVADNPGKTVITESQWTDVNGLRASVMANNLGGRLLSGGQPEVSFFMRDKETGLIVKCRADYLLGDLIVDLKTCISAHPEAFAKHALSMGYHIQDAVYRDVSQCQEFAFVAAEKEPPYVVTAPLLFDDDARRLGHLQYRDALNRIAECLAFNVWPSYTSETVVMGLKPWDTKQLEELEKGIN